MRVGGGRRRRCSWRGRGCCRLLPCRDAPTRLGAGPPTAPDRLDVPHAATGLVVALDAAWARCYRFRVALRSSHPPRAWRPRGPRARRGGLERRAPGACGRAGAARAARAAWRARAGAWVGLKKACAPRRCARAEIPPRARGGPSGLYLQLDRQGTPCSPTATCRRSCRRRGGPPAGAARRAWWTRCWARARARGG